MDLRANHEQWITCTKDAKQELVTKEGVGQDLWTCLVIERGGTWLTVYSDRVDMLLSTSAAAQMLKPDAMHLIQEIYHLQGHPPFSFETAELHERYINNDPFVGEAIAIMTTAKNEDLLVSTCRYRYAGRTIDWDIEPTRISSYETIIERAFHEASHVEVPPELQQQIERDIPVEVNRWTFLATKLAHAFPCQMHLMTDEPPPLMDLSDNISLN